MRKTKIAPPAPQPLTDAQVKRLAELSARQKTEKLSVDETGERADLARQAYVFEKHSAKAAPAATPAPAQEAEAPAPKKAPRRLAKKASTKPAPKAASNAVTDGNLIPLKVICGKLGIDPKRARVVLRRRLRSDELAPSTHEIGKGRWNLSPAKAERVRETLRNFLKSVAN